MRSNTMRSKKPNEQIADAEFMMPTELLDKVKTAFWLIEDAEILEEESDTLIVRINRDAYEDFIEPMPYLVVH